MNTFYKSMVILLMGILTAAGASPRLTNIRFADGTALVEGLRIPTGRFKILFNVPKDQQWGAILTLGGTKIKDVSKQVTGELSYPDLTPGNLEIRLRVMGQPDQTFNIRVVRAPSVAVMPAAITVIEGDTVTLQASTGGGGPVNEMVWKLDDQDTGSRGAVFSFVAVVAHDGHRIVCEARGPGGVDRVGVPLTVRRRPVPPRVVVTPGSVSVEEGTAVRFQAGTEGGGSVSEIRWLLAGADTGVRGSSFAFTAQLIHNGQSVVAEAHGPGGAHASAPAVLTVTKRRGCPVAADVFPTLLYPFHRLILGSGIAETPEVSAYGPNDESAVHRLAKCEMLLIPEGRLRKSIPPANDDNPGEILNTSEYLELTDWCGDALPSGGSVLSRVAGPFPIDEIVSMPPVTFGTGRHVLLVRGQLTSGETAYSSELVVVEAEAIALEASREAPTIPLFPGIALRSPASGAQFAPGTVVSLIAVFDRALPEDRSRYAIERVEFLANGRLVATARSAPWASTWTGPAAGHHTMVARAYDREGARQESAPVTIEVLRTNLPPVVRLSGMPDSKKSPVRPGDSIRLVASASDPDGTVREVSIRLDGRTVVTRSGSTCEYLWAAVQGTHRFAASATDDRGGAASTSEFVVSVVDSGTGSGPASQPTWLLRNRFNGRVVQGTVHPTSPSVTELPPAETDWEVIGQGSFGSTTKNGILWYNDRTRRLQIWQMEGGRRTGSIMWGTVPIGWRAEASGPLLGDGGYGILLRRTTTAGFGQLQVWRTLGLSLKDMVPLSRNAPDTRLKAVGVAELDGDRSTSELVWFQAGTGVVSAWSIRGGSIVASRDITGFPMPVREQWELVALGDFDGDGAADLAWAQTPAAGLARIARVATIRNWRFVAERSHALPANGAGWVVAGPR